MRCAFFLDGKCPYASLVPYKTVSSFEGIWLSSKQRSRISGTRLSRKNTGGCRHHSGRQVAYRVRYRSHGYWSAACYDQRNQLILRESASRRRSPSLQSHASCASYKLLQADPIFSMLQVSNLTLAPLGRSLLSVDLPKRP